MVLTYALASVHLPAPHLRGPNELPDPHGGAFVTVIVLAKFGHLVALVSLEGVMIECAQREGERVHGRVQCVYFIARFAGCLVAQLAMALAFNNPEFGGTFAVAVPIRVVFAFQSLVAGVGIAITVWWIKEDPITTSNQRFSTQMRHIWHIMQQPTTWRIAVLGFVEKLGTTYEIRESNSVQILSVVFVTCGILTAVLYLAWLTNSNWRRTLVWSVGVSLVAMIPIETLTTFDVYRNFTIFAIKDYIVSCCNSMLLLTRFILIVEVVDPGYEAVTYGLLTTVYNVGETVTAVATSILTAHFDPVFKDLTLDTPAVRWHVMYEYLGRYGILIVTMIVVLPFMPRQKRHVREIAERGNPTIVIPIVLFVVLGVLFSLSLASTLFAVNESTSCLPFAGGKGCH